MLPLTTANTPLGGQTTAERLSFLLTNRLPRRWLTLFMGRFSRIEHPLLCWLSIRTWQMFVDDLRLDEAKKGRFDSLHDCFIRELKEGARPVDPRPGVLVSPCDAIIGASGRVCEQTVLQAKGFPYSLAELLGDENEARTLERSAYVTLRLKSSMYHRFHAPCDGELGDVSYISGDTWNVNPVALKTVERLFCRNERAVIRLQPQNGPGAVTLVAVAAILVASMRIHGLFQPLNLEYSGPWQIPLGRRVARGEELGYFEHGSTIIVFADASYELAAGLGEGDTLRMGRELFVLAAETQSKAGSNESITNGHYAEKVLATR